MKDFRTRGRFSCTTFLNIYFLVQENRPFVPLFLLNELSLRKSLLFRSYK